LSVSFSSLICHGVLQHAMSFLMQNIAYAALSVWFYLVILLALVVNLVCCSFAITLNNWSGNSNSGLGFFDYFKSYWLKATVNIQRRLMLYWKQLESEHGMMSNTLSQNLKNLLLTFQGMNRWRYWFQFF